MDTKNNMKTKEELKLEMQKCLDFIEISTDKAQGKTLATISIALLSMSRTLIDIRDVLNNKDCNCKEMANILTSGAGWMCPTHGYKAKGVGYWIKSHSQN